MSYIERYNSIEFNYVLENEIICNETYCPFHARHISSPNHPCCEGEYCDEAFEKYCEMNPEEMIPR